MTRPTPITDSEHRRLRFALRDAPLLAWALWLLAALFLSGCVAPMPLKEGPRARLIDGIAEPRDRNDMDITLYEHPVTAWGKCLELAAARSPVSAVFSVITLSPYLACAVVPKDHELKPGQRPWCIVAVPEGAPKMLEHELRHCEGWATPRPDTARMRDWSDDLR